MSESLKISLYILSFAFPLVGFVAFFILIWDKDRNKKHVAKMSLIIAIIASIISFIIIISAIVLPFILASFA